MLKIDYVSSTVDYYDVNADKFIDATLLVDMSKHYKLFLANVSESGMILDAGCGPGRDAKFFLESGYDVIAFDASQEMASYASQYTGSSVVHADFASFDYGVSRFNGIWASASLLHLSREDLSVVLREMTNALKPNGAFYLSFKFGEHEFEKDGRLFTNQTIASLKALMYEVHSWTSDEVYTSYDLRPGRASEEWVNGVFVK